MTQLQTVVHDLQNRLAALTNALRLIRLGTRSEEALDLAERAVREMSQMLDGLTGPVPPPPSNLGKTAHVVPRSLRLLLVDDHPDVLESLTLVLRAYGHEVVAAADAAGALTHARTRLPDVALLDVRLPDMDGYELARRLRALGGPERLHLVALTGYEQEGDAARRREAGFEAHLGKPVDPDVLAAMLATVTGDRASSP